MQFGIDKIAVSIPTESILIKPKNGLTIQQGNILPSGEIMESNLFNDVKGKGAYLNAVNSKNDNHYNFTISPKYGTTGIQFNPSKILHSYHLCNDNEQIKNVWNDIKKDLKNNGILLPNDVPIKTSRIDLAKQKDMNLPIGFYAPLFGSLKAKRQNNASYPNSYYFKNGSQENNFYDKKASLINDYNQKKRINELPKSISDKLMRGETRFKNGKTVANVLRINDLDTLLASSPNYRIDKYQNHLINQVFKNQENNAIQTQMFTDYEKNLEYLKMLKEQFPSGAINKFIISKGIENLLNEVGNLDNFRQMLIEAGFHQKSASRKVSDLQKQLHQASFFFGSNDKKQMTNLYNEVYTKFAS